MCWCSRWWAPAASPEPAAEEARCNSSPRTWALIPAPAEHHRGGRHLSRHHDHRGPLLGRGRAHAPPRAVLRRAHRTSAARPARSRTPREDSRNRQASPSCWRRISRPRAEGYSLGVTTPESRSPRSTSAGLFYGGVTLWQLITADPHAGSVGRSARAQDRRFAALRVARPHARLRAALPVAGVHQEVHRLDGAAQAQHAALASDRRPGLAARDQEVSRSSRRWARGVCRRARRRGRHRSGDGQAAACTAASTPRSRCATSWRTPPARHVTVVPEIEMPGHATAAVVAYPELGVTSNPPKAVPDEWGIFPTLFNVDESTFTFLEDVLAETMRAVPGPIHPRRRRRGDERRVAGLRQSPGAHEGARSEGRARAAGLLHPAHGEVHQRQGAQAHRLG